ncbi:MAG: hypothetical protein IPK82_08560 [Polyangiaceae bacterium]|nr:hypothetical protein [Polyangiaceae bacterium]
MNARSSRTRSAFSVGTLLVCFCAVTPARGDDPPKPDPPKTAAQLAQRTATIALEKKKVVMTIAYRDAVDAAISKKLLSGLPTTIAMRSYVFRDSGGDPVALTAKSCKIVYDLWDEVFRLTVTEPGGQTSTVAVNVEGVLRNCTEAKKIPLMERTQMKDGTKYYVAVIVEVNPISADMLDRIKRWVTRPTGSTSLSSSDSLFGSFVGLFVTRVATADKRIQFRTQSFLPPNAAPPTPSVAPIAPAPKGTATP